MNDFEDVWLVGNQTNQFKDGLPGRSDAPNMSADELFKVTGRWGKRESTNPRTSFWDSGERSTEILRTASPSSSTISSIGIKTSSPKVERLVYHSFRGQKK